MSAIRTTHQHLAWILFEVGMWIMLFLLALSLLVTAFTGGAAR